MRCYWIVLRKREGTGNRNRKQSIALCGELALEEAVDRSQGRLWGDDDDDCSCYCRIIVTLRSQ